MNYNFSTIDGLFRPNYNVYKTPDSVSENDSEILQPVLATYKPQDMQRVRSVITESPEEKPEESQEIIEEENPNENIEDKNPLKVEQDEIEVQIRKPYPTKDYENFKSELEKFIKKHPQYANIKDALSSLAELESAYVMNIPNRAGSSALGWFQFTDATRSAYNSQTREEFANDPQAQLLTAAHHYTNLQRSIKNKGGNPNDFVTMYGAWWRPTSAYAYINNPDYDFKTKYNESFQQIIQKARNYLKKYGKSIS